jgi:hypothetical protein
MAVVATEGQRFGNLVKAEYDPASGYCREVVTVNLAAGATLAAGTVLAKVTATGKYLVQDASLASGAGLEAAGVLIGTDENNLGAVCATTTDKKVLMLARGPARVAKELLVMGAGTDTNAEKLAVYDALAAKGIVADTQA